MMRYRMLPGLFVSILIVLSLLLPWYQFSDAGTASPGWVILIDAFAAPAGWTQVRLLLILDFGALLTALWLGFASLRRHKFSWIYRIALLISAVGFLWLSLAYPRQWLWGIWGTIVSLGAAFSLSFLTPDRRKVHDGG